MASQINLMLAIDIPESIQVNEIVYTFSDCSTPEQAVHYMTLLQLILNKQPGVVV
jgi:hypothetical protein